MNEPLHNRPIRRDKLGAALKRNMARRKAAASKPSSEPMNEPRSGGCEHHFNRAEGELS